MDLKLDAEVTAGTGAGPGTATETGPEPAPETGSAAGAERDADPETEAADARSTGVVLPADATAPGRARRYVADVLAGLPASEDAVEGALLVVSELVTNAVTHGRADRVRLTITPCGGGPAATSVRLTVADSTPYTPLPPAAMSGEWEESGRGLALVALLSTRWSHHRTPGNGTAVRAELPL